ncbi:MAG: ATP-grasp domain-containing protein [Candidatus Thorarchaeota archaeon]
MLVLGRYYFKFIPPLANLEPSILGPLILATFIFLIFLGAGFIYDDETSRKLVDGFGLSYNVGIQVKENKEGVPLLLEINPRLQGTTVISVAGGVNIPEMMVMMALEEFDYDFKTVVKWGLQMQRVWLELFHYDGRTWEYE